MKLFKFNAYTRTAMGVVFHHIQNAYPNSHMLMGYNPRNRTTSFSGEFQFENNDIFFKATEKINHITLEFHSFDEKVEETVYAEDVYGGIKVKYPLGLQSYIRPLLEYLKPENVVYDAMVSIMHATVEDFSRVVEHMMPIDKDHLQYGLDVGFYFQVMGCRAIRDIIFGVREGKLIFLATPRDDCNMDEFLQQVSENVFIPETLYQFIDEVVIPE